MKFIKTYETYSGDNINPMEYFQEILDLYNNEPYTWKDTKNVSDTAVKYW